MDLIIFFVSLSILVFFHELGHFVTARKNGVRVDEFGLGLPPRIWGKKVGETIYSINALPIGGFCKMYGEDQAEVKGSKDRSFTYKKPWQRSIILLGGVTMNLILAILIFCGVYYVTGIPVEMNKVKVNEVAKNSPADVAGMSKNDYIFEINGKEVKTSKELIEIALNNKGKEVTLRISGKQCKDCLVKIMVRENPPEGEGSMGVVISSTEMKKYPVWQIYKGISPGFKEAYYWAKIILGGLGDMIGGIFTGKIPKDVAGPVGMYQVTSDVRKESGLLGVMHFFGVVSVNLAVVNLLPFPALDGGRLMFIGIEKITKRRVNEKVEATVNAVGMSILLGLLLLVTIGDVIRLINK